MRQEDKYIYQVYCDGSFSKAAQKLFVTQPALSLAIQRVEQQIQMPLFDRSSRPLTLTEAGRAYIENIEKKMHLVQDLQRQLGDIRDKNTGSIRLGGSHYLNAYLLPDILAGFKKTYPGIRISLHENDAATLAQMLTEKKLDMTFSCNADFIEDFDHIPAFYDHILLVVPADWDINKQLSEYMLSADDIVTGKHLSPEHPAVSLEWFRDKPFILLNEGINLRIRCQQMFRDAGVEPLVTMQLSQMVTAYRMAEHHIGATFISDLVITPNDHNVRFYKLSHPLASRLFYLLTPKNMYVSYATKTFGTYLQQCIESKHMETVSTPHNTPWPPSFHG